MLRSLVPFAMFLGASAPLLAQDGRAPLPDPPATQSKSNGKTGDALPEPFPIGGRAHGYRAAVLADHPLGYWRLDEASGPKAHDESGKGRDGTYVDPIFFKQKGALVGDLNPAIKLDGKKGHVEVADSQGFSPADPKNKGLTVEVWMKPDKLEFFGGQNGKDYTHWLGKGQTSGKNGNQEWAFRFYPKNTKEGKPLRPLRISAYIFNPQGGEGSGAYLEDPQDPPTTGEWMHIVATFDDPAVPNARVQIYKNGVPSAHNNSSGNLYKTFNIHPVQGNGPVRFGTQDLQSFLIGHLDEVAIYGYVLTPAQILHHYKVGVGK
jgi:hypothetical protein